jgi:hypothetical protein
MAQADVDIRDARHRRAAVRAAAARAPLHDLDLPYLDPEQPRRALPHQHVGGDEGRPVVGAV